MAGTSSMQTRSRWVVRSQGAKPSEPRRGCRHRRRISAKRGLPRPSFSSTVLRMKPVNSLTAPSAIGPYSQAIDTGDFVFLSGQVPIDPKNGELVNGDIAAQTERVLDNLGAVLEAAGCSFADVVKTTIYLVDLADFQA